MKESMLWRELYLAAMRIENLKTEEWMEEHNLLPLYLSLLEQKEVGN